MLKGNRNERGRGDRALFEKIRKAASTVKGNIDSARAKTRGMSQSEWKAEQADLRERRRKNEADFRGWKIDEDYRQKKKAYQKRKSQGGGFMGSGLINSIADIGGNVNKNVSGGGSIGSFNAFVTGKRSGSKKKKRKKGKVIQIVLK